MNMRTLGKSGIRLTELGFGCASMWGKDMFPEDAAIDLFWTAYTNGIRYFDTGASYNRSEMRLGQCLKELGATRRGELVISTKCGTLLDENGRHIKDWSADGLKRSLERSLTRLNTDYVDLLHLHGPQIAELNDAVLGFLEDVKRQKLVHAVGVNSFDTPVLEYIAEHAPVDFVMLDYNILRQDREPLIAALAERGIGVLAGAALAQSLYSNRVFRLSGKRDVWYFLRALKNFRAQIREGRRYRFINGQTNASGNQLALRYVLDNPHISAAVFGTTDKAHLLENIQATSIVMPASVRERLVRIGHEEKL